MKEKDALIIFAKAPVPGQVKTRLQPHLSPEECANLHAFFIIDTINIAKRAEEAETFLFCYPGTENHFFQKVSKDFDIKLMSQKGNDLGERMEHAIKSSISKGYNKVVIIGSDSPDLPVEYIQNGFKRLDTSDMVIGPSADGGYYLIGGTKELPVFDGIQWSGCQVFNMTVEKAKERGLTVSILDEWYDIDTVEDLQRLNNSRSSKLDFLVESTSTDL